MTKEQLYEEVVDILNTPYHPDINTDQKILVDKLYEYFTKHSNRFEQQVIPKIAEEQCQHKNKRYEQQFTCEEIYCRDCDEYLGTSS